MIHHFKRATRLLIFWSLIASACGITITRIFLAGIDNYKIELEQKFFELTDIELRIGSLSAGTRGFNPEIILRDIDILSVDEAGRPVLKLREVRLGVDMLQMLLNRNLLSSSWLTLVGAKVAVIRREDGSFTIKGLNAGNNQRPLWLNQAGKYEILQSEISWQDQQRHGEILTFHNFGLLVKNDAGHHELHLLSDLPGQYGDSLRISAEIHGDIMSGDPINGRVYVEGRDIRFAELLNGEWPYGITINSGRGSFELWTEWRDSKLFQINADIRSEDISLERESSKKLVIDRFTSYLNWSSLAQGWQLSAINLQMEAMEQQWPAAEFYLAVNDAGGIAAWIAQMNLGELSYVAPFFGLAEQFKLLPEDFRLDGLLQNFAVYMADDQRHFAVDGAFANIAVMSADAMPQLTRLSGQVRGSEERGELLLTGQPGSITFPGLFRDSIELKRIAGKVNWRQGRQDWRISSDYLEASNADLDTYSKFLVTIPKADQPVFMQMQTAFEGVSDVTQVPRYLPVKIMGAKVVDWLDHAFVAGHIRNGGFLLSGNLNEFPFAAGQGKFEARFDVEDGSLNYHTEWPLLTQLDADVHFFADSLQVKLKQAESEHIKVKQAVVEIPSVSDGEFLLVDGLLSGHIADGLRFMQKTPLHATVDGLLATTDIQGTTEVDLELKVPLRESVPEKVEGLAHFKHAGMTVKPVALQVNDLTGKLRFTERGVFCERLDGKVLGFPAQARIATADGSTRIEINGKSDMQHLRQQFSFLHNEIVHGEFSYITQLDLPVAEDHSPTLRISSDLQGVTVDLPAALAKSAQQRKQLRIDMRLSAADSLPVMVDYDDELKLAVQIDKNTESLHTGHIVYGSGKAKFRRDSGLKLDINQAVFDVSAWSDFLSSTSAKQQTGWSKLNEVSVNFGQLLWEKRPLGKLQLDMIKIGQYWQGNLTSPVAKGAIRMPTPMAGNNKTALNMSFLDMSKLSELNLPVSWLSGGQVPLIDIFSEQLLWRGVDIGTLELVTERRANGVHFNKVSLSGRDSFINLTADWFRSGNDEMTQLNGRLSSDDFGKLLGKLGYNDDLLETVAEIDFSGYWNAAPYQFSLADFMGEVKLMLKNGRISSIEPGFGRLLGLIAMEQWVKRFSLDFSDIYQKGLAFNRIIGHFFIREGKAFTDDLFIDAISARVKISGVADLLEKTLNHRVLVVPKSSDAVPIAGTIVGGIASVVTQVLTNDYKEGYFFGSEYKVEGTWEQAEITPLHDRDGLLKKTWTELTDFPWLKSEAN